MMPREPRRLSPDEQAHLRALLERPRGDRELAERCSVAPAPLLRAAAGLPMTRGTLALVRLGLESAEPGAARETAL